MNRTDPQNSFTVEFDANRGLKPFREKIENPAAQSTIAWVVDPDGAVRLYVASDKYLPEARHAIGCPCIEELLGKLYLLTRPNNNSKQKDN